MGLENNGERKPSFEFCKRLTVGLRPVAAYGVRDKNPETGPSPKTTSKVVDSRVRSEKKSQQQRYNFILVFQVVSCRGLLLVNLFHAFLQALYFVEGTVP